MKPVGNRRDDLRVQGGDSLRNRLADMGQSLFEPPSVFGWDWETAWISSATLLARFPEGYRHLAYLQARIGYTVKTDMPGLDGPQLEAVYARGAAWLSGKPL